ncbi:MAG: putative peroxidase-related enzyme [Parasphingorhabdus sp.]|jgi:uncharacterized peroxidase-related enzyme
MVPLEDAEGELKEVYELVKTPHGTVDNVMRAHSLRPATMRGHVVLYRSVLHNTDNVVPFWFLEVVASYTSHLNKCDYSFSHHFTNARNLINDDARSDRILEAFKARQPEREFEGVELAFLQYTEALTVNVAEIDQSLFDAMVDCGASHGEILEVNQVVAYFSYSNRLLNGLGVTTEGDTVGYYDKQD